MKWKLAACQVKLDILVLVKILKSFLQKRAQITKNIYVAEPENCDNRGNIGKINNRENDGKKLNWNLKVRTGDRKLDSFTLMMYKVKEGHFKLVKSFVSVRLSQNTNQAMFYPAY